MSTSWMPLLTTGLAIRMDLLHENQAMTNYGQTLQRLAERGGISPSEALAIAEKRVWQYRGVIESLKALRALSE